MLTLDMNPADAGVDLAARVRRLEDERDIRALLAHYAFNADLGRSRAWVELFTEDGAVDLGETVDAMSGAAAPHGYPARPRFVGHEELLLDFITALPHRRVERRSQHHTAGGPLVVEVDGDEATASGYSLLITRDTDAFRIEVAAFNHWMLRRVDGTWRIAERRIRPIGSAEAADILGLDA
jgi:SnoaL-like domain